jgi:predicted  nucleic acid-binding Zn-ribbon protein
MWTFDITNIAGIQSAETTVEEGLNVVQASNFMGKSSFVGAIQTVMGTSGIYGESHPLTEGAAEGSIRLETDDETYEVRLARPESGSVTRHGTPFLTDETDRTCARLFAFLGENNPIRERVRNGGDLTPLLQAPLDVEDIDARIAERKREREAVERQLQEAEQAASNIPSVQEAITTLESELTELREQREELSAQSAESSDGSSDELADRRSSLNTAKQTVSRLEKRLERTEERVTTKQAELEDLEVPDRPEVTADIAAKEDHIDDLELKIDLLESLHRSNQRVIEEDEVELVADVNRGLTVDTIDCWVCGEPTTTEGIRDRLTALQETLSSLREEKSTLQNEITEIERKQNRIEEKRRERDRLEETIGRLKADLDELRSDLQQARDRKSRLEEEVKQLEAQVSTADDSLSEELTDVKAEIRTRETELANQQDRLDKLRERDEKAEELAEQKDQLTEEIKRLRSRKTEKQWEIKEQFDEAIDDVIAQFAPGFDGARLDVKTTEENEIDAFELVIARDGRETEISNLSEGEQELVGIVVAAAGHRTFNVADRVPAVLLDSISQLSAENLQRLTGYLADASEILVTTAYPEAGDFGGNRISPEAWETTSDEEAPTV